jgi:tetratricopeptide (TPR) repeat protein
MTNINIPGSLLPELRPPDEVGRVEGETSEERSAEAGLLAEKHNATLLIYGVITQDEQGYRVAPAFYVNNSGWDYGGEVAGPQRLGQPIPVDLSGDVASQFNQNSLLEARVRALRNLVEGLAFYYNQKYELAAGYFQQATDEAGWRDEEGKEVVYTLLGAAYLRSFLPHRQEFAALERSRRAFNTAVSINPEYARGYLGLGSAALQQAGELFPLSPEQAAPLVWEGKDWFLTAQDATDQPGTAFVDTKIAYGLGLAHMLGAELGIQGFSTAEAQPFFEQVLSDYDTFEQPEGLIWQHAWARYYLGRLALDSDAQTSLASCQKGLDDLGQLSATARPVALATAYTWECIGQAQAKLGRLERAADAYRSAIKAGDQTVSLQVLDLWEAILPQLEKGASAYASPTP